MTEVKLEPDTGERDTRYHQRIVSIQPIRNTLSGHVVTLACGHKVHAYGSLANLEGVVLCTACRDNDELQW